MSRLAAAFAVVAFVVAPAHAREPTRLGDDVGQLIVTIADTWDSSHARLRRFERTSTGWVAVGDAPVPVLLGKHGLAWGRGVFGQDEPGRKKTEGDGRAPAGVFALGAIYGYDDALPEGADFPYHKVTALDAWVDDPRLPEYNQHLVVDPAHPPAWFEKQRMKLGDPAYRWRVEIRHNSDPPVAGAGSAIFFHIERGPNRTTAGCTTMPEPALLDLIRWLRAGRHPHYVLLPRQEYLRLRKSLDLPPITFLDGGSPPDTMH